MLRLLPLLLLAAPAAAQPVEGRYALSGRSCAEGSDAAIEWHGDSIAFWESLCTLSSPVAIRGIDGAVLYDGECRGEGEVWTQRILVAPRPEGLVMLRDGAAFLYDRCG